MYYHRLIHDSQLRNSPAIGRYELAGFDPTMLWKGCELDSFPSGLHLVVNAAPHEEIPDLIGNPLSWFVVSDRLVDILTRNEQPGLQVLPAPLVREADDSDVLGYQVLNPLHLVNCLKESESRFRRSPRGTLTSLDLCVLNLDSIPRDVAVFRLGEMPRAIFVSDEIAQGVRGKGIKGVAFIRCAAE